MDLLERADIALRHPWETARAAHIIALLEKHEISTGARLLDAGAGDSFVASQISAHFREVDVTCWDINYTVDDISNAPGGIRRIASAPRECFDIVLALDVIEHVSDDVGFLRSLRAMSHTGTMLITTVPAYQALFSEHDLYLRHFRRYSRSELSRVLVDGDWNPQYVGGFFSSLLLPRAAKTLSHRLSHGGLQPGRQFNPDLHPPAHLGSWRGRPLVTRVLERCLSFDAAIGRAAAKRISAGVPGLSVFAVAYPRVNQPSVT